MGKHAKRQSRTGSSAAFNLLLTRVKLKRDASYPPCRFQVLAALEACIHDIFSGLREEFFLMTEKRRENSALAGRLQPLELQLDSRVLNQLITAIDSETTRAFLPRVDDLVRSETEDLLSTMLAVIRDATEESVLCAGFICDANTLIQAIISKLQESRRELKVVLDQFFEDALVVFYEDLMKIADIRKAFRLVALQNSPVGQTLQRVLEALQTSQSDVYVSYNTPDLLQQMSIEQVLLYINAEEGPGKKKKKRNRKKQLKAQGDLGALTDSEFEDVVVQFRLRLEQMQACSERTRPQPSLQWLNRLHSMVLALQ
jgi:hypothetical protein